MTQTWKRVATVSIAAVMLAGSLAGCGGNKAAKIDRDNPTIKVMTKQFQAESAGADSPVMQELENYLGTKLEMTWAPNANYDEKVTATMGSGNYPHVMLVGKRSSSIIQASQKNRFWDITDKLKDSEKFPNLAQTNETVNHNISIDGKVYGLYRARTIGRAGVSIRKDWLENLNMEIPTTIDEFYNVLKAFKENDPDKNGQADTYGMILTNYIDGPLNNLAMWMGAPNEYGVQDDKLVPKYMYDEYLDALKFLRQCKAEGLINSNFATYDSNKWNEEFLTGKAGVIIDVADRARRLAQNMEDQSVVDVFGYVKKDANSEARTLPTTGYDGYYVFPKAAIVNEDDLDFVLGVMDKANDQEALNLMNFGIEGRSYEIDDEGFVVKKDEPAIVREYADLNQFATGIIATELKTRYTAPVAEKIDQVYEENEQYAVANPAEPYVSKTYSTSGPQLDAIMAAANTKFINGDISEDDWKAERDRWLQQGGQKVIDEINDAYKKDPSRMK